MKYAFAASTILAIAAANPQGWGWGGNNGQRGGSSDYSRAGLPSCFSSCFTSPTGYSSTDASSYCNATSISSLNNCIGGASCSSSDKQAAYQAVAQYCANAGVKVTASQEASFSATSGGTAWPTQWTTNSAYASALSSWKTQTTGSPGPFGAWGGQGSWNSGNGYGPFGQGGAGNGWGPWASDHSGAWTTGPWTRWWGSTACPPSTWSGWTTGDWNKSAPWTSWSACTASTTATSIFTTTVTTDGRTTAIVSTAFAVKVEDAGTTSSSTTGSNALPTNYGVVGAAAGVAGILAGAILL